MPIISTSEGGGVKAEDSRINVCVSTGVDSTIHHYSPSYAPPRYENSEGGLKTGLFKPDFKRSMSTSSPPRIDKAPQYPPPTRPSSEDGVSQRTSESNGHKRQSSIDSNGIHQTNGLHRVNSEGNGLHRQSSGESTNGLHRQTSENGNGERPSPSNTPPEDKHVWTKSEVELLLDLYEKNQDQLKDPRVRKTRVWEDIARVLRDTLDSDVNGCQCNQKFRNLKADFQKVQEHNGRPGNFKRICKYYDRLVNLLNYNPYNHQRTFPNSALNELPPSAIYYDAETGMHQQNGQQLKRKFSAPPYMNGAPQQNGTVENNPLFANSSPVKKSRAGCQCECSEEIANLRDAIERTNRYILARAAHEDERVRRLEELHREKLIAMGRFSDIFKDYIHKII